jgi:hypothetical protein
MKTIVRATRPSNPQSWNRYAYVLNNPLKYNDPTGLRCVNGTDDGNGGESCAQVAAADAEYQRQHKASMTVTATLPLPSSWESFSLGVMGLVKSFQTYIKPSLTGGNRYNGRTSGTGTPLENIAKRDAKTHLDPKEFGPAQLDKSSTSYDAIRGREQQNIYDSGGAQSQGGTSGNAINGISETNPNRQTYMNAAEEEFGTPGEQMLQEEVPNLPGPTPEEMSPGPD